MRSPSIRPVWRLAICALLAAGLSGADAPPHPAMPTPPPPPVGATGAPTAEQPPAQALLSEEEKWVFAPPAGRVDVFYDYEQQLRIEKQLNKEIQEGPGPATGAPVLTEDPLEIARSAVSRIEGYMSARKWEEAIKVAEQAGKKLAAHTGNAEVTNYVQVIKGYLDQAQDALLRDEAQAAFDALSLKVEGILWSENGPRLVLISGESRALGVNDRVKDCVIINIDTDRVDFRFHYKRKRFEFPRYVGEDPKAK